MIKILLLFLLSFLFIFARETDHTINTATQALSVNEYNHSALMENAVNVRTPGYRSVKIVSYGEPGTNKRVIKKANNFASGSMVGTDRSLDFALEGNGFFVLSDSQGRIFLTRDGRFQINRNMELMSLAGGLYVLDESNSIIELGLGNEVVVDEKGYIYDEDSNIIARLKIMDVLNKNSLKSANNVLFYMMADDISQMFVPEQYTVKQGYYESSNVDYNKLMVDMADKSIYGANTQVIQTRLKMMDSLNGLVNQN